MKRPKNDGNCLHALTTGALIPLLTLLTSGCSTIRDSTLTGRLWESRSLCVPSAEPDVKVYRRPDNSDVLITYDELRERNDEIRRRAFFFKPNLKRLEQHRKPQFVVLAVVDEMKLIPVILVTNNIPPPEPIVARLSPASQSFTLVWDGKEHGPYDLPVYVDEASETERALLTPLMVTGDIIIAVAIVAGIAGLVVLYAYASSAR